MVSNYKLRDDLVTPKNIGTYKGLRDSDSNVWTFERAIKNCAWNDPIACHMFQQTLTDSAVSWLKGQAKNKLGRMPPKTWKEFLELAREFINEKKLNAKWRNGEEASRGNRSENNMQNQDNRSRPKFSHLGRKERSDTRNIKHINTRNNHLNTLTNMPARTQKENRESNQSGKVRSLAQSSKKKTTNAPEEPVGHIFMILSAQPDNITNNDEDWKHTPSRTIPWDYCIPSVDPVVITTVIASCKCNRIYMDGGSSVDIM
ncbi:hypothetical protein Tco_1025151 [Tanacetum coccineum]